MNQKLNIVTRRIAALGIVVAVLTTAQAFGHGDETRDGNCCEGR